MKIELPFPVWDFFLETQEEIRKTAQKLGVDMPRFMPRKLVIKSKPFIENTDKGGDEEVVFDCLRVKAWMPGMYLTFTLKGVDSFLGVYWRLREYKARWKEYDDEEVTFYASKKDVYNKGIAQPCTVAEFLEYVAHAKEDPFEELATHLSVHRYKKEVILGEPL